jgi:predicted amidophosphoribosyltransferase
VASLAEGTPDSVGLSRAARAVNLSQGLVVDRTELHRARQLLRVPGAVACVVDDVCTTGATLGGLTTALAARGVVPTVGVVVGGA